VVIEDFLIVVVPLLQTAVSAPTHAFSAHLPYADVLEMIAARLLDDIQDGIDHMISEGQIDFTTDINDGDQLVCLIPEGG
jgi:hypothetical protein